MGVGGSKDALFGLDITPSGGKGWRGGEMLPEVFSGKASQNATALYKTETASQSHRNDQICGWNSSAAV